MNKTIYCLYLQKEAEALPRSPWPGELGQKILHNISKPAWDLWLQEQTILINENRLSLIDPDAQKFLSEKMQQFLFKNEEKTNK